MAVAEADGVADSDAVPVLDGDTDSETVCVSDSDDDADTDAVRVSDGKSRRQIGDEGDDAFVVEVLVERVQEL